MAERERSHTRPLGAVFVAHSQVLTAADVQRALTRMSHEVVERNGGVEDVVLVGLQTGGVPLANRMAEALRRDRGREVPVGLLDVAFYRDDIGLRPVLPEAVTDIPVDLAGKVVVLVDDVLFTGRTIRAALNALNDFGRARAVQLAVMVDRGHRELPIRPDYVGKNLPTRREEMVDVGDDGRLGSGRWRTGEPGVRGPTSCRSPTWVRTGIAEVLGWPSPSPRSSGGRCPRCRRCGARSWPPSSSRSRPGPASPSRRRPSGCRPTCSRSPSPARRSRRGSRCATRSRRSRPWASTPSSSATPPGAPHQVARWVERAHVVNAGDGWHEHPTQALIDCFTVRQVLAERKGVAPEDLGVGCFEGLRVLIVGDVRHSRVARSEVLAYSAARGPRHAGRPGQPAAGLPRGMAGDGGARPRRRAGRRRRRLPAAAAGRAGERVVRAQPARVHGRLGADRAAGGAPAVEEPSSPIPGPWCGAWRSPRDVADCPARVMTQQVTNGVAVRMAILFLLLGGEGPGAWRRCRP